MKVADKQIKERYLQRLSLIRQGSYIAGNETREEKAAKIERMKADIGYMADELFPHYATSKSAWFHKKLGKMVLKNKRSRILVRWGRGLAKSIWCNVIIPLWLYINDEELFMVLIGNNEDKAIILLSDIQAEFEANPRFIHYFGEQKLQGSWESGDFQTKDGRFIGKALGMGQSPLGLRRGGKRPNYISADDLEDRETARNPKRQDMIVDWLENAVLPLMDGDTMRYVHPNNDPWERSIQNELEKRHPNWDCFTVEAYDEETFEPAWKEKYDKNYYKAWEDDIGSLAARAQFNHKHHKKGKIFTDEMIQWGKAPRLNHFSIIVGHWDPAFSGNNDYNAVKVWGSHGFNFWQLKAFVKKCKMADAIRFMYEHNKMLPESVVVHWQVEEQFWGDPMRDALKLVEAEYGYPLNLRIVDRLTGNKYDRMVETMMPYYQNNRIYYDIREKANNDMQVGIDQLKGIEPGYKTHDDSPDADTYAIKELGSWMRVDGFEPRTTSRQSVRANSKNRY